MVSRSRRIAAVALGVASVLSGSDADAQIYRWVDRDGNVHYTDRPQQPGDGRERPAPPAPVVAPSRPAPPPSSVSPELRPRPAVRESVSPARPTGEVTVKRSAPPPRGIAGTPLGPADAEQRRTAMIDEIFSLLELPMWVGGALPEAAEKKPTPAEAAKFRGTYAPLVRASFRPYFVDQHAEAGLVWLRSPLGRSLDKALATDAAKAGVDSFAARPDAVSPERGRLLSRFARASQYPEIAITPVSVLVVMLQFMMMEVLPQAFEAAAPPPGNDPQAALLTGLTTGMGAAIRQGMKQHTTPDALRASVDEVVYQAGRDGRGEIQKQLAYRLRDVGNDELTRAIQFYEGDAGQWLGTAVRLASREAAASMVEETLKEMRASGPVIRR